MYKYVCVPPQDRWPLRTVLSSRPLRQRGLAFTTLRARVAASRRARQHQTLNFQNGNRARHWKLAHSSRVGVCTEARGGADARARAPRLDPRGVSAPRAAACRRVRARRSRAPSRRARAAAPYARASAGSPQGRSHRARVARRRRRRKRRGGHGTAHAQCARPAGTRSARQRLRSTGRQPWPPPCSRGASALAARAAAPRRSRAARRAPATAASPCALRATTADASRVAARSPREARPPAAAASAEAAPCRGRPQARSSPPKHCAIRVL
eukprot:6174996-Pleurochrysis_carterae.AAC.2